MRWIRRIAALPLMLLWLGLRIARLPVNLALYLVSESLEVLFMDHREPWHWPGWRSLWGWY